MSIPDYIKPGAFVRLRDGWKAEIYSTGNNTYYSIHGRVFNPDKTVFAQAWAAEGSIYPDEPWHLDIVGPWVERPDYSKLWPLLPPWILWLARDANGELFGYPDMPYPSTTCWRCTIGGHLRIPPAHHPPAVGDWKDSLQERPAA